MMMFLYTYTLQCVFPKQETPFIITVVLGKVEKEMTTHSNTLVWRIPQMKEPRRLQSMGLQRVRHD